MSDRNYLNQYSIQSLLIGKKCSGKTTLIEKLVDNQTKSLQQYWSCKEIGISNIDLQFQEFQTTEIDERFILEISQSDYPIIVILVFDVNDPSSLDEIVNNYSIIQMLKTIGISQGRFILLGVKHDLKNEVQDQDISHFLSSQQYNLQYQNVSALSDKGIKELKQTLFNLAKQQIIQIIPNTSTGSKWESMDEKLDDSYWNSNQSYSTQNRQAKIVDRKSRQIPQIEEVMNILDTYKNNYFDNQLDYSYQQEEQSLNSQYEEYTEAQSSQSEKMDNEHISSKISNYEIECKQDIYEQQENSHLSNKREDFIKISELEQSLCKKQINKISRQMYDDIENLNQEENSIHNSVNKRKRSLGCELKHDLIQQQQVELDRYFQQIGKKSLNVNKFNTIISNSSQSSSYSRIHNNNKKCNDQSSLRSQQIQAIENQDSSCSSEKWEIGVLEHMSENCQNKLQFNDLTNEQNGEYSKKLMQQQTLQQLENSFKQINHEDKFDKIYANPLNDVAKREHSTIQINQSTIERDSQEEYSQLNNQKDMFSEASSYQISSIHYHQIHSHKQQYARQSLLNEQSIENSLLNKQQKKQSDLNKSQVYQVKIDLENNNKNDQIVFQEVKNKNRRNISNLNKSAIYKREQITSKNSPEKENINIKQDKNEPNSFIKKKNSKYLMSLCLQFKGQNINLDVLEGESSFDLAHKFCKNANIYPTINQIKRCSQIIQQQIDEYSLNLDKQLEVVERKVLEQQEGKFEILMNKFLKENKNFLADVNYSDFSDYHLRISQKINLNSSQNILTQSKISQNNQITTRSATKTPQKTTTKASAKTPTKTPQKATKTNLYVRSKSPTPLFKSSNKL